MKRQLIVDFDRSNIDLELLLNRGVKRSDVHIELCSNKEANDIFLEHYWMKRVRRSRRLSYTVFINDKKVAWIQVADPFGTRLKKPFEKFELNEVVELCRGYFIDETPANIESCAIGMMA